MEPLRPTTIDELRAARERIAGLAVRTPLVRLEIEDAPAEIWLKLENLQPIGSFKVRGAANALLSVPRDILRKGVYTASAGNMAQGVAYIARYLGVPCAAVVPEGAPAAKTAAIERLGAKVVKVPFDEWWRVMEERRHPDLEGHFVHPVSDPEVIAGNGTIGLEILEALPSVDTVLVPYGGGGLSCGIAAAARALAPGARVFACEVETAAPFTTSVAAGAPHSIEYRRSFVDGIGAKSVLAEMWPLSRSLLAGSLVVEIAQVAAAVRTLAARAHVIAEGAGAVPVAAALEGEGGGGVIVCIVSGGNIDAHVLAAILRGEVPWPKAH